MTAVGSVASVAAIGRLSACDRPADVASAESTQRERGIWAEVRSRFALDPEPVQLAGMFVAPHPDVVREAIHRHRTALDADPARYVEEHDGSLKRRSREAGARYMGVASSDVGLTDSTTMGIGLTWAGLRMRPDQEVITTDHAYRATHDALELRRERDGVSIQRANLGPDVRELSADQITDRILSAVNDSTRALALTWVHSSTGLKLPVRTIADRLREHNEGKDPAARALLCLDGVHGLGVEDEDVADLGCDIFFAGTHKWVFAPRGTGVIWAHPDIQDQIDPVIPTFIRDGTWGGRMSPGGFKPFEHQWSMAEAFEFHDEIGGRAEVRQRIHSLAGHLREELHAMSGVQLRTPLAPDLSSGVVAFDVEGLSTEEVVGRLADRGIIGSVAPYGRSHTRFSPGLLNTEDELERALDALRDLA